MRETVSRITPDHLSTSLHEVDEVERALVWLQSAAGQEWLSQQNTSEINAVYGFLDAVFLANKVARALPVTELGGSEKTGGAIKRRVSY
jgi:hypothetical protein